MGEASPEKAGVGGSTPSGHHAFNKICGFIKLEDDERAAGKLRVIVQRAWVTLL